MGSPMLERIVVERLTVLVAAVDTLMVEIGVQVFHTVH